MKKALITGITGQDGAYLSQLLLKEKYQIVGIVREFTNSKFNKLKYLGVYDKLKLVQINQLDFDAVKKLLSDEKPDEIYNLAAQSSVAHSFHHPEDTYKFNILSVLNLLEAIRTTDKKIKFYQASSSEMYGKTTQLPITEKTILNPISPYGTSKAAAHWMVRDYRNAYGLFAVSGILFNHESYLREESFFVKKIIRQSIEISNCSREYIEVGNLNIKRDFGYSPYYVQAMWKMLQTEKPEDYVISSGISIELKDIVKYIFKKLNINNDKIRVNKDFIRPNDIVDIYGDNSKAKRYLNWEYKHSFYKILDLLIKEEKDNIKY